MTNTVQVDAPASEANGHTAKGPRLPAPSKRKLKRKRARLARRHNR